ncbi:hypothetical protein OPV22_032949 [Ensete ventricosum]|uniref:Uncharacterized protein n=1 Tax=Ensete ventricosum TaxID=4639 RepID=A0AAV8PZT0_ENSVE|nr:hypothetical protein OPV22_032949 [Ensete ventricosum]
MEIVLWRKLFVISTGLPAHGGDDLRDEINKTNRTTAVLENAEEGEKYSQHSLRRFLSQRRPEVFPALNRFFSGADE